MLEDTQLTSEATLEHSGSVVIQMEMHFAPFLPTLFLLVILKVDAASEAIL